MILGYIGLYIMVGMITTFVVARITKDSNHAEEIQFWLMISLPFYPLFIFILLMLRVSSMIITAAIE